MNAHRYLHTATLLLDGQVLVAGGVDLDALDMAELYDPTTATWSFTGNMLHERNSYAAARLLDGRVLAAGGRTDIGYTKSAELYDPVTKRWSAAADMMRARVQPLATLLGNGMVVITGGANNRQHRPAHRRAYLSGPREKLYPTIPSKKAAPKYASQGC